MDRTEAGKSGLSKRKSRFTKLIAVLMVTTAVVELPGCGSMQVAQDSYKYNSAWNSFVMKHRNQGFASKAWHRRKHRFCNEEHLDSFNDGFRAGYLSVAEGGDGCTPAFAPREYWGWEYQSAEGQRKVSSWFAGFPHGCRAAEEDGVGNWSQIQTSYGVQKEYHKAGLLASNQSPGMYPMPEAIPAGQVYIEQLNTTNLPQESLLNAPPVPGDGGAGPVQLVPEAVVPDVPQMQTPPLQAPVGNSSVRRTPGQVAR